MNDVADAATETLTIGERASVVDENDNPGFFDDALRVTTRPRVQESFFHAAEDEYREVFSLSQTVSDGFTLDGGLDYEKKVATFHQLAKLSSARFGDLLAELKTVETHGQKVALQSAALLNGRTSPQKPRCLQNPDSEWEPYEAREIILSAILASKVQKAKRKKKKKRKLKAGPGLSEDLMTPEEALLDYQNALAKARVTKSMHELHEEEERSCQLQTELYEVRQRFEQNVRNLTHAAQQTEAAIRAVEGQWRNDIDAIELGIKTVKDALVTDRRTLETNINRKREHIRFLRHEVDSLENFRNGEMVRNDELIQSLQEQINNVETTHARYMELTELQISLSEKFAQIQESSGLDGVCEHHVNRICEDIAQSELQQIEFNGVLSAELTALSEATSELSRKVERLQDDIIQKTTACQRIVEMVNGSSNIEIVRRKMIAEWGIGLVEHGCYTSRDLLESMWNLDELKRMNGGLRVNGLNLFSRSRTPSTFGNRSITL